MTHEHSQPDRACQPEALVVRVSDSDREAASLEAGLQIENTKHLHIILRHGELLTDDGNLTVTQGLDQGFHDRSVGDRNMGGAGLDTCYSGSLAAQDVATPTAARPPVKWELAIK